jgi:hypothetical protein
MYHACYEAAEETMVKPNRTSVLRRIEEYNSIGRDEFIKRYAGGRRAKAHVISFEDGHYDLKAVWAAAHEPCIAPRGFNTKDAREGLQQLKFECVTANRMPTETGTMRFEEGERRLREMELFTRHPGLATQAKVHYGLRCQACDFDLQAFYGDLGAGYIECHHLNPLADQEGSTLSGIEDVTVLCANCHRMVHKQRPPLTVKELRRRIRAAAASKKHALRPT